MHVWCEKILICCLPDMRACTEASCRIYGSSQLKDLLAVDAATGRTFGTHRCTRSPCLSKPQLCFDICTTS